MTWHHLAKPEPCVQGCRCQKGYTYRRTAGQAPTCPPKQVVNWRKWASLVVVWTLLWVAALVLGAVFCLRCLRRRRRSRAATKLEPPGEHGHDVMV